MAISNQHWLWLLFASALAVIIIIISPMLMYTSVSEWMNSWQVQMFGMVCHQELGRTFSLNGVPAAVCARCTGFYSGLFAGFLCIPVIKGYNLKWIGTLLAISTVIVIFDGLAQMIGFWSGGNIQRFITGLIWGGSVSLFLIKILKS